MSTQPKSNTLLNLLLVLLGILAALLLSAAIFLAFQYKNLNDELVVKDSIIETHEQTLDSLYIEIENLKTELRLQQDKYNVDVEEVVGQLESLKVSLKSSGGGNISAYKAQVKTLKEEVAGWEKKSEDWATQVANLQMQIKTLESNNQVLNTQNQSLASEKENLNKKVETGAVLQISSIDCKSFYVSKKGKEKELTKAGKVNKLECCFTIFRNKLAEKSDRTAYLVIRKPNGDVVRASETSVFETSSGLVNFSAKKNFSFNGENTDLCISVDLSEDLEKGSYLMEVFIDGTFSSEQTIDLK